jgi:hypothetical protein
LKTLNFKEGETVEDFGMRITNLVTNIRSLGETIDDTRVVKKFLHVVPARFNQVVVSIEMFCDVKALTVEDLVGRLRAAEERFEDKVDQVTDKTSRLLLAEEEWLEKNKHRLQTNSANSHKSSSSGGTGQWKPKASNNADGGQSGNSGKPKLTSKGTHRRKGRCHNCGIYGHWQLTASVQKRTKGANNNLKQMWLLKVKNMELSYCLN